MPSTLKSALAVAGAGGFCSSLAGWTVGAPARDSMPVSHWMPAARHLTGHFEGSSPPAGPAAVCENVKAAAATMAAATIENLSVLMLASCRVDLLKPDASDTGVRVAMRAT
jgi:hypothetical protein